MTQQLSKSHRRQFLQRSLMGVLSVGFIPATISTLFDERDNQHSLYDLLNRLAFKKLPLNPVEVVPKDEGNAVELPLDQMARNVYKLGKAYCIHVEDFSPSGRRDWMAEFYQESYGGIRKVITLNRIEVQTLRKLIPILNKKYNITKPEDLRALLVPSPIRNVQALNSKTPGSADISAYGYSTRFGHCSMHIVAKGNRLKINASLLDKSKKEVYRFRMHETFHA